eukprot:TRINITY_DN3990_c0_g4_i1.p1 TRINITY_DN3990_c0_g4~~TRINITY_DN3990_c0_g4_i1.p1  ORF type:complete len:193 (+),score=66.39 TRINITY_DN3990_c0_g4_i1:68-580(+)
MADMEAKIQEFLDNNPGIDEKAIDEFKECTPEVVELIIARGSFDGCRNKSASLSSRIRDAKLAETSEEQKQKTEDFLAENEADEGACAALRGAPGWVQKLVVQRGSLEGMTNKSAVIQARTKEARQTVGAGARKGKGGGGKGGFGGKGKSGLDPYTMQVMMTMFSGKGKW